MVLGVGDGLKDLKVFRDFKDLNDFKGLFASAPRAQGADTSCARDVLQAVRTERQTTEGR